MRGVARIRRSLAWGLLTVALAAAALGAAACGPGDDSLQRPVYPDASQRRVATLSDPTWRVAPSLTEQIVRSTTIVRATLQSATAAVVAEPDGGGYRPVQELRFTTHEYLKGSGPATLLVAVRGATRPTQTRPRPTRARPPPRRWRDGSRPGTTARACCSCARPIPPTRRWGPGRPMQPRQRARWPSCCPTRTSRRWAYSVDTLSRAWLPARDPPAEGVTPTAFITDEAQTPPSTITLG